MSESAPKSIHDLWTASDDYATLKAVDPADALAKGFDGSPVGERWSPVRLRWTGPLPHGDVTSFRPGAHVFSPRALAALGPLLEGRGELLPVEVEGEEPGWAVLNVTRVVDALDEGNSEILRFDDGGVMEVNRFEFHRERLAGETVFKIPQLRRNTTLVTDRFAAAVEKAGLEGFDLLNVWPGQEHPLERLLAPMEAAAPTDPAASADDTPAPAAGGGLAPEVVAPVDALSAHLDRCVGPVEQVLAELVPGAVRVDVLVATAGRGPNSRLLVSCGMSSQPMAVPEGAADPPLAELVLALPDDWPISREAFEDESRYWPVRLLKRLARLPHEQHDWLGRGHTAANDPREPFPGTRFTGSLIAAPQLTPGLSPLPLDAGSAIGFHAVYPLYPEELELAKEQGSDVLVGRLAGQQITELVDLERPNVALFEDRPVGPVDVRRIVPIDEPEDEHLEEAQLALETAEVHPDEHANLAWVPADAKLDTPAYHRVLSERLRPIQGRDQAVAALRQLRAELEAGTIPH